MKAQRVKAQRRGRRHLDGSAPGQGNYLHGITITLRPFEIEELERIANGNRSAAVRRLLAMHRETADETMQPA